MEFVKISINDLNVLRETFKIASQIIEGYGVAGSLKTPSVSPKETKREREIKYSRMIDSKLRGTKPNYLKKKNGKNN